MKRKEYLFLFFVLIVAFWQVSFLQNGMKWDFVDAYLPSRYFFSESILNNQFPLWNPYLLYGTPIYADLTSVFNPEFWIIGNMFGYSNVTLQYVYLAYNFIAGVSFFYFLKQFGAESKIALGLSVAYMLSGFTVGNAQHLSFVFGFAVLPFVISAYYKFLYAPGSSNFLLLAIALYFMIYGSYPGLTIILGYFLLAIFLYFLVKIRKDKAKIKQLLVYHLVLLITVLLFSAVLFVAYIQAFPFLSRYGGISAELALQHPFSLKSFLSFVFPMATGNNPQYFETDISMSNGYWGIIGMVLFLFCLTRKVKQKESYLFLVLGVLSLLASIGEHFFLRKLLFDYAPLMDMFKYPAIFRSLAIFSFLAFVGINLELKQLTEIDRKKILAITGMIVVVLLGLISYSLFRVEEFVFFDPNKSFAEEILSSDLFSSIIFQGVFQLIILLLFSLILWRLKELKQFSSAVLLLFVIDGVAATQLSIYYTVVSDVDPIGFYDYLKASPKGFPIPELNPIGENSDKNASSAYTWMNNNVFPKKVTYDGLVSFKLDGYAHLADNYPALLDSIKKEPLVYFSDDVRENSKVENFNSNTVFVSASDYQKIPGEQLCANENDHIQIRHFSPNSLELTCTTQCSQLLTYQQNYYNGWSIFVDGKEQDLIKGNFAHMSVLVPKGDHTVLFNYSNPTIIYAFAFCVFILLALVVMWIYYFVVHHPDKKRIILQIVVLCILVFMGFSVLNRYFYAKNKRGLTPIIIEKIGDWKIKYNSDINVFLSTHQNELGNVVNADTTCFVNENTNLAELSHFMLHSETNYFVFAWQGGSTNDDILELIYSFYPNIINQEIGNNSGIVLLSKDTDLDNYVYCEDFDSGISSGWPIDKSRLKIDSCSGNISYAYEANQKWGTTLSISVDNDLLKLKKVLLVTDIMMNEKLVELPLVFSVQHNGKNLQYNAALINRFVKSPDQWSRAAVVFDLNVKLQEGDLINLYFWNKDSGRFQIDNIKLKLIYSIDS